jgi:hypothetical protein
MARFNFTTEEALIEGLLVDESCSTLSQRSGTLWKGLCKMGGNSASQKNAKTIIESLPVHSWFIWMIDHSMALVRLISFDI